MSNIIIIINVTGFVKSGRFSWKDHYENSVLMIFYFFPSPLFNVIKIFRAINIVNNQLLI